MGQGPTAELVERRTASRRTPPRVGSVLAVGILALGLGSSTPCQACSCAGEATAAQSSQRADVVFVGTLVDTREALVRVPGLSSSSDPVAKVFEVAEVRKGEVPARVEVLTASSSASCGLEVETGRAYVVVARDSGDGLRASLCGGTRLLSAVSAADLGEVGQASAPSPGTQRVDIPVVDRGVLTLAAQPVIWGPTVAFGAAVLATVVWLRRRRRA